jgi:hypothetical protein
MDEVSQGSIHEGVVVLVYYSFEPNPIIRSTSLRVPPLFIIFS